MAQRGVRTTRRRRRPPHTPTLPLPTSFIFTVALDAQRNELVCIVVICMCLMVVPACPIYPSLYTKNHQYTRREARQGEVRRLAVLSPFLPLPSASLRPYSSATCRWNNGTMDDLRAYAQAQAHRQRQRRLWERVQRALTWLPVRLSRSIFICIKKQETLDPRPSPI